MSKRLLSAYSAAFSFPLFDYRFDYCKNPKRVKEHRKKRILPKNFLSDSEEDTER